MTDGAHTPRIQTHPDQPANLTDHTAGSEPAPAKPCQPPVTSQQIGPLAQAERRPGEFLRLALPAGSGRHWAARVSSVLARLVEIPAAFLVVAEIVVLLSVGPSLP